MTLDALRREFEQATIGPQIWGLVSELSRSVSHRYPPGIYNAGEPWSDAAVEDLAQDVVVECLLGESQLRYIFDVADDLESFRRLLTRQVKRTLYRRRSVTVVDRLLARAKQITAVAPFRVEEVGRERWITMVECPKPLRSLDQREIRAVAAAVADIPRLPESTASGRASMVYTTPHLTELVTRIAAEAGGVTESDLAKILEILLTAWLPTFLEEPEESQMLSTEAADSSVELTDLIQTVRTFVAALDDTDCVVLLCKTQNIADASVAARVGRSRPWVADRKRGVLERIDRELMSSIHPDQHGFAATVLLDEVGARLGESTDVDS